MEKDKLAPLAIVGLSFRFPGEANTYQGFWDVLSNAKSTRTRIPDDRFNIDGYYHPSPDRQGAIITKEACFLTEDVGLFDAPFFSLTAAEAEAMDPQHRILLEVTYEAFENAGISIRDVAGSQTACYVGGFSTDYVLVASQDLYHQSQHQATGCGNAMMANRISWFYDLRGPSFSIDTACSSSMVALHEACRELQDGSSSMAVVAGSSLILNPEVFRPLSAERFLSPDGACHCFDAKANGYGRGEGIAVILVKSLADALRDNDVIRAVIRGSGVNQDGKTPGITVPNARAQMSLIETTYERAGLDFSRTAFFEAHGTGTPVGDPLELLAIGLTIGAARSEEDDGVLVGSVKSNIGHLEGSSGIAGIIKTIMALEYGAIPAVAEFESPNPRLRLDEWRLKIPMELTPWPVAGLRRASVNSFGYGGTNGHVILDDAMHYLEERGLSGNHNTSAVAETPGTPGSVGTVDSGISMPPSDRESVPVKKLFAFTSPEQEGLTRLAESYANFIRDDLPHDKTAEYDEAGLLRDLSYTLGQRRTIFDWRSFALADSADGLQKSLEAGLPKLGRAVKNASCAWVFTGQGAQWFAMGRELQRHAVFRASIEDADAYMASIGGDWSVIEELGRDKATSRIDEPQLSQPLCTALQVALVDLLRHWGLQPKAVVGHSSGEIGAAYAAGALSRESAWKVAYWRGRRSAEINQLLPGRIGCMMAVATGAESAQEYIGKAMAAAAPGAEVGDLVVACINSPKSVTLSGDDAAVTEVKKLLQADGIWCRKLLVKTAYHSPHVKVIADQYLRDIEDITTAKPESPSDVSIFSSVAGAEISHDELGAAEYWIKNLVSPVRFSEAVTALLQPRDGRARRKGAANVNALVEIGPHAALRAPLREILTAASESFANSVSYTALLQRGDDALETAMGAAGRLWSSGFDLDLGLVNSLERDPSAAARPLVNLPRYPWNHKQRFWWESRALRRAHSHNMVRTDLLGYPTGDYTRIAPAWRNHLSVAETPWLVDHKVHGTLILPGAVYIAIVLEACSQSADGPGTIRGFEFRDVLWHKPIIFESRDANVEVVTRLRPHHTGTKAVLPGEVWRHFTITTISETGEAFDNCSGLVMVSYDGRSGDIERGREAVLEWEAQKQEFAAIQEKATVALNPNYVYNKLGSVGLQFGPTFRNLTNIHAGDRYCYCDIVRPDTASTMPENFEFPTVIHPAVMDSIFQMMACTHRVAGDADVAMLPSSVESLYVSNSVPSTPGSVLRGYFLRGVKSRVQHLGTAVLSDESWDEPMVVMKNLVVNAVAWAGPSGTKTSHCNVRWVPDVRQSPKAFSIAAELPPPYDPEAAAANAALCDGAARRAIRQALEIGVLAGGAAATEGVSDFARHLREYGDWMNGIIAAAGRSEEADEMGKDVPVEDPQTAAALDVIASVASKFPDMFKRSAGGAAVIDAAVENGVDTETKAPAEISTEISTSSDGPVMSDSLAHEWWGQQSFTSSATVEILDSLGYLNPNLEILEIGTGSTACVAATLERLGANRAGSRINKYILAAQDPRAIESAKNTLGSTASLTMPIEFKTLDIEQPVEDQGFETGKLDCVVLNNLALSVSDPQLALENIRELLKPDGKLVIHAVTTDQLRTAFVLGSTPAWWRESSRPGESVWDEMLRANGFSGVDQAFRDSDDSAVQQLSVMCSSVARGNATYEARDVLLVTPPVPSAEVFQLVANVASTLDGLGLEVAISSWNALDEQQRVSGRLIISFVDIDVPVLMDLPEDLFEVVRTMAMKSVGILWLTRGGYVSGCASPGYYAAQGLFRTIRSEDPNRPIASLDLSTGLDLISAAAAKTVVDLFESMFGHGGAEGGADKEFAEDGGAIYVQRLIEDPGLAVAEGDETSGQPAMERLFQANRPLKMTMGQVGVLDAMQFEDHDWDGVPLGHDFIEVKVLATGLNFVDVMSALGEIPASKIGLEFAGVVTQTGSSVTRFKPGDTVVGCCYDGFASHARMVEGYVKHMPDNMSVEESVTIPVTFATAWMSLVNEAKICKGESALIHVGAGGVGQAAIQVCQHFGLEVFATVGSEAKKSLLMERYGIPDDHIFYSRDTTFAQGVRRMTGGRGVDVVLNSVAGELLRQSWHLIADFGRFVEIGKRDILRNAGLDMEPFIRSVSFIAFNLDKYYRVENPQHAELENALEDIFGLFRAGKFRSIYPVNVFSYGEVSKAFRALQSGKMLGKVVVKANPDDIVPVVPPVRHRLALDPNATYLLTGGLGGIGRSLALMLESKGAKNLAFFSRSGGTSEKASSFLQELKTLGCVANGYACDITDRDQLVATLRKCSAEMPPIKGVIQCAMVLRDVVYESMSYDDWVACTRPKIQGSWNLHDVLPKDLDFFIMLCSSSGIIGNPGQANYSAGNTFEDGLAVYRRRLGLRATALDIGAVRDVGYLADSADRRYWDMAHLQALAIDENDVHRLVKAAISGYSSGDHEMPVQIVSGLGNANGEANAFLERSLWARDGKLSITLKSSLGKKSVNIAVGLEALAQASTAAEAAVVVEDILMRRIATAVMISLEDMTSSEPLSAYGVNSLVAVEIRTWLAKEFQTEIPVGEIPSSPISSLAVKIVETSKILKDRFK